MCTAGRDFPCSRALERLRSTASNRATNAVHRSFPRVGSRPKDTTSHDERANHSARGKEEEACPQIIQISFADKLALTRKFLSCFLSHLRVWRDLYHSLECDLRGVLILEFF